MVNHDPKAEDTHVGVATLSFFKFPCKTIDRNVLIYCNYLHVFSFIILGQFSPQPLKNKNKYNKIGAIQKSVFLKHDLPDNMATWMAETANMALAQNTKSNYQTVKNNIQRCSDLMGKDLSFPWDTSKTLCFVGYLLHTRKVKAKTVNCQLSGVRMAHIEEGLDCPSLRPPIVALLLRGKEHWENAINKLEERKTRAPVTIAMMKLIKRELCKSDLPNDSKRMIWAISCLNWAGSLRNHESLAKLRNTFDEQTTLLGQDVTFHTVKIEGKQTKMIKIKLKSTKESRIGAGTTLEIFENHTFMCPVAAMQKYINTKKHGITFDKPFFRDTTGKNYTGKCFNNDLKALTARLVENSDSVILSHSFRAGVASEMAKRDYTDAEIMAQGRWSSDAYKIYCKLPRCRRLLLSNKLVIKAN